MQNTINDDPPPPTPAANYPFNITVLYYYDQSFTILKNFTPRWPIFFFDLFI